MGCIGLDRRTGTGQQGICVTTYTSWQPGLTCPAKGIGGRVNKKVKLQLYGENKKVFLDGMRKYMERGIPILIDGKEVQAGQLSRILEVQEDGSFYMGDYIWEQDEIPAPASGIIREPPALYQTSAHPAAGGVRLKEIRFDRVYHQGW